MSKAGGVTRVDDLPNVVGREVMTSMDLLRGARHASMPSDQSQPEPEPFD